MSLSPERRRRLLASTKEQAAALLDDLTYLQSVITKTNHTAAEIRRDSAILRRILVERDLVTVSAPRIGRLTFSVPNNQRFYKANDAIPILFFSNSDVTVFGSRLAVILLDLESPTSRAELSSARITTISSNPERFLSQRVLCLRGQWVNRGDVIKYVANITSGVHSGTPKTPADNILSQIRRSIRYWKNGDNMSVTFDTYALRDLIEAEFQYRPDTIDPTLVELLGTIKKVVECPDIRHLQSILDEEFASH